MRKLLLSLLVVILAICLTIIYASTLALDNTKIVNKTIISNKIDSSFDDIKIVFFSDIQFGEFVDDNRLNNMINIVNECDGDIVIFGGDLLSNKADLNDKNTKILKKALSSIDAPLGKFAILGDQDNRNSEFRQKCIDLLYDCDFEVIENQCYKLYNNDNAYINLIGMENIINGDLNYEEAIKAANTKSYNILVSHCPDILSNKSINPSHIDLALTAHTLGGQVYIPFISEMKDIPGASIYYRGTYDISGCELIVNNGLGTKDYNYRLFTRPEIHVFHLRSKTNEVKTETKDEVKEETKTKQNNQ